MIVDVGWLGKIHRIETGETPLIYTGEGRSITVEHKEHYAVVKLNYNYSSEKFRRVDENTLEPAFDTEWSHGCTVYPGYLVKFDILDKILTIEAK